MVSREIGEVGAVYFEPTWVNNTNTLPAKLVDDNDAFLLGLGARFRVSRRAYLVAEAGAARRRLRPRVHAREPRRRDARRRSRVPDQLLARLGTTMGQVARGGSDDDWFIGFNISRKFW